MEANSATKRMDAPGPMGLVASRIKALIDGLRLTLRHLFSKSITMKYPYEKRTLPAGYRGLHVLRLDLETRRMKCIGCTLCARACPDHLITIETSPGEGKKKNVDVFDVDISRCMFCNLCVEACPHGALELSSEYELATETRDGLIYHKEDLLEKLERLV
ncbi:MAG: NADH-quinone oxidoreductase subunit I [Candidatus Eiseniibacteriota bacterium]|nr:MAG: NADH-quinone oxidoreductase subunit I [Candidatus Eisenbacteria bacterium]